MGSHWQFGQGAAAQTVDVSARVSVNASEAMRPALLAGLGIAVVPAWLLREGPEAPGLVPLLDAHAPPPMPMPIQAVFPSRRLILPRARAYVDFIAAAFRAEPMMQGN